jgi:hypothetical protein
MMEENVAGEGAPPEPQPDTLAALLTASLSAKLAEAVSELVGAPMRRGSCGSSRKRMGVLTFSSRFFPALLSTRSGSRSAKKRSKCRCRQAWWMSPPPKGRP